MSQQYICQDCGRHFTTKRSLNRHAATACKKHGKSIQQQIDELTKALKDMTLLFCQKFPEMKESLTTTINNVNNNVNNSRNISGSNNVSTTNNYTIIDKSVNVLLNFGLEDTPFLTHDKIKYAVKSENLNEFLHKVVIDTHFNPELPQNMNIYANNMRGPGYYYQKGSWKEEKDADHFAYRVMLCGAQKMSEDVDTNFPKKYNKADHAKFDRFFQNIRYTSSEFPQIMKLIINNKDIVEELCPVKLPSA
jgi:hypothetical protein